jgi:hypothetical protein
MQAEALLTRPQEFETWKMPQKEFILEAPPIFDKTIQPLFQMKGFENHVKSSGINTDTFFTLDAFPITEESTMSAEGRFTETNLPSMESMGFTVDENETLMNMETFFNDALCIGRYQWL